MKIIPTQKVEILPGAGMDHDEVRYRYLHLVRHITSQEWAIETFKEATGRNLDVLLEEGGEFQSQIVAGDFLDWITVYFWNTMVVGEENMSIH
jgi:hypothetical protein